jgi:two-component sensor histidine kinase
MQIITTLTEQIDGKIEVKIKPKTEFSIKFKHDAYISRL